MVWMDITQWWINIPIWTTNKEIVKICNTINNRILIINVVCNNNLTTVIVKKDASIINVHTEPIWIITQIILEVSVKF